MDNLDAGLELWSEATHLLQGGFTIDRVGEAAQLIGGAKDFFRGLKHQFDDQGGDTINGLAPVNDFAQDWSREEKSVFMFSGCKDSQTSADAFIMGKHVGAMSWAFLETMKHDRGWSFSFLQILESTRNLLQQNYSQIPQLSCGYPFDLNRPLVI
ncbi:hypothetical protein LTR05_005513 [Lithohypha guttulata]|uniref:Peptidase C14 caspase domain-containing protein n=1 Tax=Lithohypha guttulata TaxID=1690604 RepID=A0AAN7SXU1_9EURO|nr:hypothetical protein LTR05_005513 [Lithohypha guttulata]